MPTLSLGGFATGPGCLAKQPDATTSDSERKVLKRATIGTDLTGEDEATDGLMRDGPNLDLAAVAGHMLRLRKLINNNGQPIKVDDLSIITEIDNACDQVYYWALVESRFPDSFSALCECEVVETLAPLLGHDRPVLVQAALRVLSAALGHSRTRAVFARKKLPDQPTSSIKDREEEGSQEPNERSNFERLFTSLTKFPYKEGLLSEAIGVARASAAGDIEAFLTSDCISGVIAAMGRFPDNTEIQKRGCLLFADVVGHPRDDPGAPPVALLFVHIGVVVDFVLAAYAPQRANSAVVAAVAHFLNIVTSYPQNLRPLMAKHGQKLLSICEDIARSPVCYDAKTRINVLSTLGSCAVALTHGGRKHMALLVRDALVRTTDVPVIVTCVTVLHAVLRCSSIEKLIPDGAAGDNKTTDCDAPTHADPTASLATNPPMTEYDDMKRFYTASMIPQCISVAVDHFGQPEGELAESALQRVGIAALREMAMTRHHWL